MEPVHEEKASELSAKIQRQSYKKTDLDDIKELIKDRVKNSKGEIISKQSILNMQKERWKFKEEIKKTNYYDTDWIEAFTWMFMYISNVKEYEKQILRANYNLESNNQIFRALNMIYNNDLSMSYLLDENNYILKVNLSFFLIEYIFETINKDLANIINNTDNYKELIDNLISKYHNNIQTIGEVLASTKPKDQKLRNRYNEINDYLRSKGYNPNKNSRFKYMRNASSHGEFYPDFDNPSNIKIIVEGHGLEKETISYLDLIEFTESKLDLIKDQKDIALYLKLFRSNNITNTILSLIENPEIKDELISKLCILSLFNIIQYNNENYFRVDKHDTKKESYADQINLKHFFSTSYSMEERTNFEIMQTIKNALGHMNVTFNNGIFTFDNKMVNEQCTCSLKSLLIFITKDELYNLTISTTYYERFLKISSEMREELHTQKTFSPTKYMTPIAKKIWEQKGYPTNVDLSKYQFYDINLPKKR